MELLLLLLLAIFLFIVMQRMSVLTQKVIELQNDVLRLLTISSRAGKADPSPAETLEKSPAEPESDDLEANVEPVTVTTSLFKQDTELIADDSIQIIDIDEPTVSTEAPYTTTPKEAEEPLVDAWSESVKASSAAEPAEPSWLAQAIKWGWSWLTGGNSVARVGILILFFGFSFLLKYAAEHSMFPPGMRLLSAAVAGFIMLAFGWRLRDSKREYGLLLQGGGIGLLYLTVFGGFHLYNYFPVGMAFALLVVISMFAAFQAVVQNAPGLAIAGFIGGYLTPILVSSGTNNYLALFSYYGVLNMAVSAIAWFRSWRLLNLIAFAFTFVIATTWGVLRYLPEDLNSTQPFLILFFLQFVGIAVLFATRQPPRLKGYVDGTLIFGTPIVAFGLQLKLMEPFEYGAAISSMVVGVFYLLLATILRKRAVETFGLLSEVFVALALIFLSLAIPFAIDPDITAAAWALESAGLYWIGARQNRLLLRLFALLLQAGSILFFIKGSLFVDPSTAFLNSLFIGSSMIAIAAFIVSWLIYQGFEGRHNLEFKLNPNLFLWGLFWWLGSGIREAFVHFSISEAPLVVLSFLTMTGLLFLLVHKWKKWRYARYLSWAFIAILPLCAVLVKISQIHPFYHWGALSWIAAFAVGMWIIWQADREKQQGRLLDWTHNIWLLTVVLVVTWEGSWQIGQLQAIGSGWGTAWMALPSVAALWSIIRADSWPIAMHSESYYNISGVIMALFLVLWSIGSAFTTGDSSPLPWIPLLNIIDLIHIIVLATLYFWLRAFIETTYLPSGDLHRFVVAGLIALAFLWLNLVVMRTVHHWSGIAYNLEVLLKTPLVQTAFSILWTVTGVSLMLYANRHQWRKLWLGAAVLIGVVVLKLFLVDLDASGTIERILSFIVVGVLLVAIGFFAPIPERREA